MIAATPHSPNQSRCFAEQVETIGVLPSGAVMPDAVAGLVPRGIEMVHTLFGHHVRFTRRDTALTGNVAFDKVPHYRTLAFSRAARTSAGTWG